MREYIQRSLSSVEVPKKGGLLPDNVFIGPHLRPLPQCRLIASIKFHRATTMSFKCISSAAARSIAWRTESRAPPTIYFIVRPLYAFFRPPFAYRQPLTCCTRCTKFVLFARPCTDVNNACCSFVRADLTSATTHYFDALTKMGHGEYSRKRREF